MIETQKLQSSTGGSIKIFTLLLHTNQLQNHHSRHILLQSLPIQVAANHNLRFLRTQSSYAQNVSNNVKLASLFRHQRIANLKRRANNYNRYFKPDNMPKPIVQTSRNNESQILTQTSQPLRPAKTNINKTRK